MSRNKFIQIENKHALLELLEEGRAVSKIFLANNAYKDPKTQQIVALANQMGILIEKVSRKSISRRSTSSSHESIIGLVRADNMTNLDSLLEDLYANDQEPFFLILTDVERPAVMGRIFRSAFAAGVNGVITPVQRDNILSDQVVKVSMGTCLRIPIVEMNLFECFKTLNSNAVETIILTSDQGESVYESELIGPKAIVVSADPDFVVPKLVERSDKQMYIPKKPGLGAIEISTAAALISFEKARQDAVYQRLKEKGHPSVK